MLKKFKALDVGIDLGTANTVVFLKGEGIVIREPSVVALDKDSRQILAIGRDAYEMVGKTPGNIVAVRPMKDGVIADFDMTQLLIEFFIKKIRTDFKTKIKNTLIGIPWGITEVEKRAVFEAGKLAGQVNTRLIDEPMAAAVGAGMDVAQPLGRMIVDIGGGTTEIAVISLGGMVHCQSLRMAGDQIDQCIMSHCRKNYNLLIGDRMAERIKIGIGTTVAIDEEYSMDVRGRDLMTGIPKNYSLSSYEIRDAISEVIETIVQAIKKALEKTPPELASDITSTGIVLSGGGALLKGLTEYIGMETNIPIRIAEDPLSCVAKGTGEILENSALQEQLSSVIMMRNRDFTMSK
ncbi:rod shape-determining protein [bacterium]|nr:rod shape-determining protein [bacterium]